MISRKFLNLLSVLVIASLLLGGGGQVSAGKKTTATE